MNEFTSTNTCSTHNPSSTPSNNNINKTIKTINDEYQLPSFTIKSKQIYQFQKDGYTVFPTFFHESFVDILNERLEYVLRGIYNTGIKPDKYPKVVKLPLPQHLKSNSNSSFSSNHHTNTTSSTKAKNNNNNSDKKAAPPLGYSGNKSSQNKVLQIINIHKSDSYFHQLISTPSLGYIVSKLMNWSCGARLAQDQIWAKPPYASPLAYHRDSPYFMFHPNDVCTVWITFDDLDSENLGPLVYVKGSHLWGEGRVGSAQNFFQNDGGMSLLYNAAEQSGISRETLEFISMKGLKKGGISVHNGRTWHGSGGNTTDHPRRGIGLHFVPADVKWTIDAMKSRIWRRYVQDVVENGGSEDDVRSIKVDEKDFPIIYR